MTPLGQYYNRRFDELKQLIQEIYMPEQNKTDDSLDLASGRFLNESAIKSHALLCSKTYRAGKFTRVGADFMDEVKADVEALVRNIRNQYSTLHPALQSEAAFATGALMDKVEVSLNGLIARLIQNKVQRQPTCGCTLGRTR